MNNLVYVLDTNTIISAIFWTDSIPALALKKAQNGQIITSQPIVDEWREVLHRPKFDKLKSLEHRLADLNNIIAICHIIPVTVSITACRDPKDDMFLAVAKEANATLIVSGDKDLLDLNPFEGIPIITARAFVERGDG